MQDLNALFERYGTDKGCYAPVYEPLFKGLRTAPLRLLEVGIGTLDPSAPSNMVGWGRPWYRPGGSLRAWRDYFPGATVYGLDTRPETLLRDEERIETHLCDSTDGSAVQRFFRASGEQPFDVVIDDGSHSGEDQLQTLTHLFPLLTPGGIYVVEDVIPDSSLLALLWPRVLAVVGGAHHFLTADRNLLVLSRREAQLSPGA